MAHSANFEQVCSEEKALTLEDAIRKFSALAASACVTDRGVLKCVCGRHRDLRSFYRA